MYQRTNEALWRSFEQANNFFLMNSSNLEFMVEAMVTQIMWLMSSDNPNIVGYFQCIMQMSGNGHYSISQKEGVIPDRRKPNSTGADFTLEKITDLFQMQLDRLGLTERENLQAPHTLSGFTDASITMVLNATVQDGILISTPPPSTQFQDYWMTEIRGNNMRLGPMIKEVLPRNNKCSKRMFNTGDPEKTNMRKIQNKTCVARCQVGVMASNLPVTTKEGGEEYKTATTVTHVMPPGSEHYHKRRRIGPINNQSSSSTSGRQVRQGDTEAVVNIIPFSHTWTCAIPMLMNYYGVMPINIADTTLAFLDWVMFLVKDSADGVIGKDIMESFNRMKNGYEARQVGKSLWTKCIMHLSTSDSEEEAMCKVMQTSYANVMPIHDSVCAVHSFLSRSIHMGALMMVACIVAHLEVPIIPLEDLKHFFDTSEVFLCALCYRLQICTLYTPPQRPWSACGCTMTCKLLT
jgi:hypothetical protein